MQRTHTHMISCWHHTSGPCGGFGVSSGLTLCAAIITLLSGCAAQPPAAPMNGLPNTKFTNPPQDNLAEVSIVQLQQRLQSGTETSRSLCLKYLARIDALDRNGPALNSVIELNPDALAIADELDRERSLKGPRGPLHGIPVLVKDNIATADRMHTTAGSLAMVSSVPAEDAFIIKQLRTSGAVILGKTNLSEWANIRSTRSSSGWSARGGQTKNPYALDHNPSGSSSGSAVAIAASLAAIAVGTETDGSIVSPAAANGLVGMKPTVGLLSRTGIIPISHTQDTAGPMARGVEDAAILLDALAAQDPADPATRAAPAPTPSGYWRGLKKESLQGARIGVVRKGCTGYSAAADRVLDQAITDLKRLGAVIVDPADIPTVHDFSDYEMEVLLTEFKADLPKYFTWLGAHARFQSLTEVIAFNNEHAKEEMPFFGQELFLLAESKGPLTNPDYLKALEHGKRLAGEQGIDAVMQEFKLDAFIAPTGGPAWLTDHQNGDATSGGCSGLAAVSGYPHITVPAGSDGRLPIGLSFFGAAWTEAKLLNYAFAYEQGTLRRTAPQFHSTATE